MARTLIVVEDYHAERELRETLRRVPSGSATVLTADALLAMRLRREGVDAHLAADRVPPDSILPLDQAALAAIQAAIAPSGTQAWTPLLGDGLGAYLEYLLIPTFIRAVRNVSVVGEMTSGAAFGRMIAVGTGSLPRAARLVAARNGLPIEVRGTTPWVRLRQMVARARAGRHTRWVNTELRSLILEPAFLLALYANGLWSRVFGPRHEPISGDALIISGDRWTADVVSRLGDPSRTVIVAGPTQPGRALFQAGGRFLPIERWTEPADIVVGFAAMTSAAMRSSALVTEPRDAAPFTVDGVSMWPLVGGVLRMHLIIWIPLLRQLRSLVRRVARSAPGAAVLTSADVTAYMGTLVAAAREQGLPSTTIQHGLMGEPNGHSVVRADVMAAWGPATEAWHRERAPQTARFVITGNTRLDGISQRAAAGSRRSSPDDRRGRPFTIVVCTGFVTEFSVCASQALNLTMIDVVLDWAGSHDDVRVVHKMHPGEEPAYYAAAGAALGWHSPRLTVTNEPILQQLLESADVLVTGYSGTTLEAVLVGTPVVVADLTGRHLQPIDRLPGVAIAYTAAELHRQLDARRAAGPPDRETLASNDVLREYLFALDGRASERVAALVETSARGTPGSAASTTSVDRTRGARPVR